MTFEAFTSPPDARAAFISIIGAPNAGKSTLTNALVGAPISIVTPKVQTTRTQLRGILMVEHTQLILIDTPGVFAASKGFEKKMVDAAWQGLQDADMHLFMIDAKKGICDNTALIFDHIIQHRLPSILVLNKIDTVSHQRLLALTAECNARYPFTQTFMISALTEDGIQDIVTYLAQQAPLSPWMYDPEDLTNAPLRFLAAEITREQLFMSLHHELPYQLAVLTESWKTKPDGSLLVHQVIYVHKPGQKEIIIGKGASRLKAVNIRARHKLEALVKSPVHLFLHVKVKENWSDHPETYSYTR